MLLLAALALIQGPIPSLEARVKRNPLAYNVRALADAYLDAAQYQKASDAYAKAAILYGKTGDTNAQKVLEGIANRYRTTINVYQDLPPSTTGSLAKFEPASGCYLGANIEREDSTRDPQAFNNLIQKHHAIFFMYRQYGKPFPTAYAKNLKNGKCALQLAFEPKNLDEVHDDIYLRQFAKDAKNSGIPVFLRYASEMNGTWTPYNRDPAKYIEKFRLVARVMREAAPNVAMVWCPNEIPQDPIPKYFPGDDVVDWVGVNFYSVIYNDADRARSGEWKRPEDALDYIYRTYSKRHPIMVGEWAASHRSSVDNRERPDFASLKIAQFYSALPRIYPRVKAVSWLSFNALKYAQGDRMLNNYSLYDNQTVADSYHQAIAKPYYLDQVSQGIAAPTSPVAVLSGTGVPAGSILSAYIRSYDPTPTAKIRLESNQIANISGPGPYEFKIPADAKPGLTTLSIEVHDLTGRVAGTFKLPITVQPPKDDNA